MCGFSQKIELTQIILIHKNNKYTLRRTNWLLVQIVSNIIIKRVSNITEVGHLTSINQSSETMLRNRLTRSSSPKIPNLFSSSLYKEVETESTKFALEDQGRLYFRSFVSYIKVTSTQSINTLTLHCLAPYYQTNYNLQLHIYLCTVYKLATT